MKHVLLVDDNPDQLFVRELLLTRYGFQVFTEADSAAAARTVGATAIDCVVMDLFIPKIEAGLELLDALSRLQPRPRIVVLTGRPLKSLPPLPAADAILEKGSGASLVSAIEA